MQEQQGKIGCIGGLFLLCLLALVANSLSGGGSGPDSATLPEAPQQQETVQEPVTEPAAPPSRGWLSKDQAAQVVTEANYADGVWGYSGPQQMIVIRVPADSDTDNKGYLVQSRWGNKGSFTAGTPYDSAEEALDVLITAGYIKRFRRWKGNVATGGGKVLP